MRQSPVPARFLVVAAVLVLAGGCTRSFPTTYREGNGMTVVTPPKTGTVAVARFEDRRSFAQRSDKNARAMIATQSPWMFGLTHRGRPYCPVAEIVQDLFVTEFRTAGIPALPLAIETTDPALLQRTAREAQAAYALGGQILAFEFVNDVGVWTVTSRRAVTLSLTLLPVEGPPLFEGTTFSEADAENEGMAVLHATNVGKLMNGNFKIVLNRVIAAVAARVALLPADVDVRLAIGGLRLRFPGSAPGRLEGRADGPLPSGPGPGVA